jgi:hypothetical protein
MGKSRVIIWGGRLVGCTVVDKQEKFFEDDLNLGDFDLFTIIVTPLLF